MSTAREVVAQAIDERWYDSPPEEIADVVLAALREHWLRRVPTIERIYDDWPVTSTPLMRSDIYDVIAALFEEGPPVSTGIYDPPETVRCDAHANLAGQDVRCELHWDHEVAHQSRDHELLWGSA